MVWVRGNAEFLPKRAGKRGRWFPRAGPLWYCSRCREARAGYGEARGIRGSTALATRLAVSTRERKEGMGWPLPGGCDRRRRYSSSARTFCCVGAGPRSQQTTSAAEAFRVSGCDQPGHTQTRGDDYLRAICLGAIRTEYFAHAPLFDSSALSAPHSQASASFLRRNADV